jgi:hypothetical protein
MVWSQASAVCERTPKCALSVVRAEAETKLDPQAVGVIGFHAASTRRAWRSGRSSVVGLHLGVHGLDKKGGIAAVIPAFTANGALVARAPE